MCYFVAVFFWKRRELVNSCKFFLAKPFSRLSAAVDVSISIWRKYPLLYSHCHPRNPMSRAGRVVTSPFCKWDSTFIMFFVCSLFVRTFFHFFLANARSVFENAGSNVIQSLPPRASSQSEMNQVLSRRGGGCRTWMMFGMPLIKSFLYWTTGNSNSHLSFGWQNDICRYFFWDASQ